MNAAASSRRNDAEPTVAERRARDVIETFPLDRVIRRYQRDLGVDRPAAERNMRELARFLALGATAPTGTSYPMLGDPDALDGAWHTFLLFTELYADFCAQVGRFVHHSPEDAPVEAGEELLTSQEYVDFLRRYRLLFGEPAPVDLWPRCRGWHIVNGSFGA